MTLEEAVKSDVGKSLEEWAKYIYLLGYETAKKEIIHCKECKNLTHSPHKWYCPVNKRVVEREEFCCRAERRE